MTTQGETRYRGRTPGEAMRKARTELGENARLVDARRLSGRGQFPLYEVRVLPPSEAARALPESPAALRGEKDPAAERWFDILRQRGAGASIARAVMEAARLEAAGRQGLFQALRRTVAEHFGDPALAVPPGERSTVVVGPTGAGKTTVLARLATARVARGERPILVSTDGESIAGDDALRAAAHALELPLATAFLPGQVPALLEGRSGDETWFVDTPGRAPFDDDGLAALRGIIRSLPDPEVLLVVPAATDVDEAKLLLAGYGCVGVDRVVVTKLDELCRPARILDLASAIGRPVALVTYGRSMRGTSSVPSDARVVSRILGTSLSVPEAN
jgi:flagellar biosynthesis GTPase FlhF